MNAVVLIGRLTKDPELAYTQSSNNAVCKFTLAVDRPKRSGEDGGTDFIRIVAWGKTAELCDKYLARGRQIAVQGRIATGSYKNRDGQTVYTTDVVADRVMFLGKPDDSGVPAKETTETPQQYEFTAVDDDLPY